MGQDFKISLTGKHEKITLSTLKIEIIKKNPKK